MSLKGWRRLFYAPLQHEGCLRLVPRMAGKNNVLALPFHCPAFRPQPSLSAFHTQINNTGLAADYF